MASRADRPHRDDDRSTSRPDYNPPENGARPHDDDDRPHHRARTHNGNHRPDPMKISNALSDTFAHAVERGATLLGNNIRAFQDETTRFVSHRVERDMEAMEEIARSRSLMELFSAQQRWFTNLTTDYSNGFMRLSRMTGEAAEETMDSGRRLAEQSRRATDA
jgi:hypothetical protein